LSRLAKKRERILIPTPVLGEVLVHSGNARAQHVQILKKAARFRIAPFDEVAAIQAAEALEKDLKDGFTIKSGAKSERAVIKVDRQIVQIAKIEQVRFIYSNDEGVAKLGERAGISVIDFDTISLHLDPLP
jgi:predicted nucleic acid-binding protein